MKLFIRFYYILFFFIIIQTNYSQSNFYYVRGEKIYLQTSEEYISIKLKKNKDLDNSKVTQLLINEPNLDSLKTKIEIEQIYKYSFKGDLNGLISRLKRIEIVESVNPVYTRNGYELISNDKFVVQFTKEVSLSDIETLNRKYNVEIVRKNEFVENQYIFQISKKTDKTILEIANIYYENLPCEWSEPDFYGPVELYHTPNDTYYQYQYYLPGINVPDAWNITKGSLAVTTAVIDEGGGIHPDIPSSRIVPGWDYYYDDSDPTPGGNQAHGMACAGIIAASQDNNIGISGIAPNSKIMFLRIVNDKGDRFASAQGEADAFDFARINNADIISCSWGNAVQSAILDDAINRAITLGRDPDGPGGNPAKGCVVIFAAGNGGSGISYPGNLPGVITVGAIDRNNTHWNYSNSGTQLELVAQSGAISLQTIKNCIIETGPPPSIPIKEPQLTVTLNGDIWTTDIEGNRGSNPGTWGECTEPYYTRFFWTANPTIPGINYTANFGGTSAAAPQVSGIAALILSVNPNLTNQQVRDILINTADKLPGMDGEDFTNAYGYGKVNAYKALKYTLENYGGNITQSFTIPSGETWNFQPGVTLTFSNNSSLYVEGLISAIGTASNKITFDFVNKQGGLELIGVGSKTLKYCIVKNANTGISTYGTTPIIQHCDIINNNTGINLGYSGGIVSNNIIQSNSVKGIRSYSSSTTINNNTITGNATAVSCENYSSSNIAWNNISNNSSHAIYVYSSSPIVQYNSINSSNIYHGIIIEGASNVQCYNNKITKVGTNLKTGWGIYYGGGSNG